MLGIHEGNPAIFCPVTGVCVVVFRRSAWGWSKAVALAVQLSREIAVSAGDLGGYVEKEIGWHIALDCGHSVYMSLAPTVGAVPRNVRRPGSREVV